MTIIREKAGCKSNTERQMEEICPFFMYVSEKNVLHLISK